ETFCRLIGESYRKKDSNWILRQYCTNGVPPEFKAAHDYLIRRLWDAGDMDVTSLEAFRFEDYTPTLTPGWFRGRKLRFCQRPSHLIVFEAERPSERERQNGTVSFRMPFPVVFTGGAWLIVGSQYADEPAVRTEPIRKETTRPH